MSANNSLRLAADTILKEKFAPGRPPTVGDIEAAVVAASLALAPVIPECGKQEVQRLVINTLQASWNVYVEDSRVLELKDNRHKEWLTQSMGLIDPKREPIRWRFWNRYANYLESEKGRPDSVIRTLDKATTEVLKRLEDPKRPGPWDRRGMVVGSVQSGKTGNYTGLICKAVDAGYRLVIVLAGMHENLRRQTQVRLDEELRGRQTRDALEAEHWIGVGRLDSSFTIRAVTTSAIDSGNGDFSKEVAQRRGLLELGSDSTYMVVKKNGYILNNINKWLKSLPEYRGGKVRGVPLLVIDDECDQASVNTREVDPDDPEQDMTAINKQVRRLLSQFEQSAYVGYTATPFANIFIPPDSRDINVEEDLFPRDFIVTLEPPSNYIGPAELFGLRGDPDDDVPARPALPLLCPVTDHATAFPPGHRKEHVPASLSPTLKEAIRQFILSCAIRWQRGQSDTHNSMLVHVSRFNNVQEIVERLITEEYESLKTRIEMNDGDPGNDRAPVFEELREVWERTYVPTSPSVPPGYAQPEWGQILPFLRDVGTRIQVRTVNGLAKALAYDGQSAPINVIAVGGDKFSRGFTLEGLTISYYLRATNMYDTLMQMGRWFGYRDGYLDLCRIYTTPGLQNAYRLIAGAIEELRRDFRRMARESATPLEFGHKVRLHPGASLLVTSRVKSRSAVKLRVSLDGRLAQTLVFPLDPTRSKRNFEKTEIFFQGLLKKFGKPQEERGLRKWVGVEGEAVANFITDFDVHGRNSFDVAELLPKYIEERLSQDELTTWTVAFDTSLQSEGSPYTIADIELGGIVREREHKIEGDAVRIKVLTTPRHEMADLDKDQRDEALRASIKEFEDDKDRAEGRRRKGDLPPRVPYPDIIRRQRSPQNGLLLLYFVDPVKSWNKDLQQKPATGFGVSFPQSDDEERGVEYLTNKVHQWESGFE